jgi:5-methylthioribose kinase
MPYKALDAEGVVEYIQSRPSMSKFFPDRARPSVCEVGDGNLNMVFIVRNQDKARRNVVLKQALPYLRIAGESWPLTRERMRFETQALLKYNELAPGLVPEVYDHDEEMSLVIMECLDKHEILRKPLVARVRFLKFVDQITTFLANSLFYTSDLYLTGLEKKELQAKFINPHLCKIQEDFVYTNPYMSSPENKWNALLDKEVQNVRTDSELKQAIAEMKEAYMTHGEALIHSDLHTGSIMVNQDETRVIDPEFAFYGPMAYDVGALLQNLVLNYLSHFAHTPERDERESYQAYLLKMVCDIWNEFARKFNETWAANNRGELMPAKYWDYPGGDQAFTEFRRRRISRMLQETAGHGGVKFLRRMMGIVSVWDITSIESPEKRAVAERAAIRIGKRWILERKRINRVEDLVGIVEEETRDIVIP